MQSMGNIVHGAQPKGKKGSNKDSYRHMGSCHSLQENLKATLKYMGNRNELETWNKWCKSSEHNSGELIILTDPNNMNDTITLAEEAGGQNSQNGQGQNTRFIS